MPETDSLSHSPTPQTAARAVRPAISDTTARPDAHRALHADAADAAVADSAAAQSGSTAYAPGPAPFVAVHIDSVGRDSVCRADASPFLSPRELRGMRTEIPAYTAGVEPAARTRLPGYDSGVLVMLLVVFLFLSYNIGHYSTLLTNFGADLFSVRKRKDVFEQHTYSETGLLISIVIMACFSEGILLNSALGGLGIVATQALGVFGIIAGLTVIAIVYYLWQLLAYRFTGYLFTDRLSARMWLVGFNSSQALAGMLLVIPAVVVLFNPGAASVMVPIAAALYLITRLIFIWKGFRLFYDQIGSIVYFILYLCSLEIVPLVLIYRGVVFLNSLCP